MADKDGSRRSGGAKKQNGGARDGSHGNGVAHGNGASAGSGCTQAQLRRFIKSRAYVPMHELRRRFAINGEADDVVAVDTRDGRYWAGLPPRESGFLADLIDKGEVGLELCHDPCVDMIIGVYAIRPVSR